MKLEDFTVSGDTIIWVIIALLFFGNILSYKMGFKDGVNNEKIEWLEQNTWCG